MKDLISQCITECEKEGLIHMLLMMLALRQQILLRDILGGSING